MRPQKAHPCAKPRRLSHKPRKSVQRFALGRLEGKNGYIHSTYILHTYINTYTHTHTHTHIRKKCTFSLYFTPTWGVHGLTDLNQVWHTYGTRRRNQFSQISSRSGKGFLCGDGVKMGLSPLPANTTLPLCIALPCMQVKTFLLTGTCLYSVKC